MIRKSYVFEFIRVESFCHRRWSTALCRDSLVYSLPIDALDENLYACGTAELV